MTNAKKKAMASTQGGGAMLGDEEHRGEDGRGEEDGRRGLAALDGRRVREAGPGGLRAPLAEVLGDAVDSEEVGHAEALPGGVEGVLEPRRRGPRGHKVVVHEAEARRGDGEGDDGAALRRRVHEHREDGGLAQDR